MDNSTSFYVSEKHSEFNLTKRGKLIILLGFVVASIILFRLIVWNEMKTKHQPHTEYQSLQELKKNVPSGVIVPKLNFEKGTSSNDIFAINLNPPAFLEFKYYEIYTHKDYKNIEMYATVVGHVEQMNYPYHKDGLWITTDGIEIGRFYYIEGIRDATHINSKEHKIIYYFEINEVYYEITGTFVVVEEDEADEYLFILDDWLIQIYESMFSQL